MVLKQIYLLSGAKVLLLSFLMVYCTSKSDEEDPQKSQEFKLISLDPKKKIEFSDFAKDLEYVVLESNPDFFVSTIDKIEINDSKIFILSKAQKTIFIFNKSGNAVGKISDFGDGPGKYSGISDFNISDNFIYLLTSPSKFVYKYDFSGNLIQIIPTNNSYIYELIHVSGGWIGHLRDAFDSENNYNVVKWDTIFSRREKEYLFIESERRNNSLVVDRYFSKTNQDLFVIENFSNQVYNYKNDSLFLMFEILIDKQGVQEDFLNSFISSPNRAINQSIEENIFTGFKKILSTDEILFLESMKGAGTVSIFTFMSTGKSISYFSVDFKFDFGIAGSVIGSDGKKFVMQISENVLNNLKDLDLKGEINETNLKNDELRKVIELYEKEGNPVLVFFGVDFNKL